MSSYWRVVPTFRLARQLYRDMYGPLTAHRFVRDRYLDNLFRSPPWAWQGHSKMLVLKFNESIAKHWEEFSKDTNDSFGVNVNEAAAESDKSTGADEQQIDPPEPASPEPAKDFKVTLDLTGFAPEDLSVKIVRNTLLVEAKHESTKDGSHFRKSYTRKFVLPDDVDLDALKSSLSPDGMLSLTAPRSAAQQERTIPIDIAGDEKPSPQTLHDSEKPEEKDNEKDS